MDRAFQGGGSERLGADSESLFLAELLHQLIELFATLSFERFGFALRLAPFGVFLEALTQDFGGVLAVFFRNISDHISGQVVAVLSFLHGFQVAQRVGVHAERDAQGFAFQIRLLRENELVDANGQCRVIAKDRIGFLQGFEQRACFLSGGLIGLG